MGRLLNEIKSNVSFVDLLILKKRLPKHKGAKNKILYVGTLNIMLSFSYIIFLMQKKLRNILNIDSFLLPVFLNTIMIILIQKNKVVRKDYVNEEKSSSYMS